MTKSIGQSRLLQEMKSMVKDKAPNIFAQPLENDLFIWHFTILGPENTDFHQGIYHGQIVLPFEYPFKPPDIYFFTKNGRFEVSTKICLTITQFHPEEWNAGWTIRTMLEAVISLFNQHVPGVGFLQSPPELRRALARDSKNYVCPKCGPVIKVLSSRKPLLKQIPVQQQPKINQQQSHKKQQFKSQGVVKQNLNFKHQSKYQKIHEYDMMEPISPKQKIQSIEEQYQSQNPQKEKFYIPPQFQNTNNKSSKLPKQQKNNERAQKAYFPTLGEQITRNKFIFQLVKMKSKLSNTKV